MSWMEKLYSTYEQNLEASRSSDCPLMPICHTTQNAQVEIVIDENGNFLSASVVPKSISSTLIPCTEESEGRTGTCPVNHPLCDKLQYIASDFVEYGGNVTHGFRSNPKKPYDQYVNTLEQWASSQWGHVKLNAILSYVKNGKPMKDLIGAGVLHVSDNGVLLGPWVGKGAKPDIYNMPIFKEVVGTQCSSFVRWKVQEIGETNSGTWEDDGLIQAWISHCGDLQSKRGFCMVLGRDAVLAESHPKRIRNSADQAKLISSNDNKGGYRYRGKFLDADQACGVSFEVSQKAHKALNWLLNPKRKQAFRNGDQHIVTWAVSGKTDFPDPLSNTFDQLGLSEGVTLSELYHGDAGQAIGHRLKKMMHGYRGNVKNLNDIVIMGVDSASPGRISIIFYHELQGSELLDNVEYWQRHSWYQSYAEKVKFIGSPSLSEIAEAAYGTRIDDSLKRATVKRLLPCILNAQPIPDDILNSIIRRVCNRVGLEFWEWSKCLGIACALYRGKHINKNHSMKLETENTSRDYLYGRLLAIAQKIESLAVNVAGDSNRDTNAERYMNRFSNRPFSTWTSIELSLRPYLSRLNSKRPAFYMKVMRLMSDIQSQMGKEFLDDKKLTGEFLLGYHCQWLELNPLKEKTEEIAPAETEEQAA